MADMPTNYIKQVQLGTTAYDFIAGYLNDGNGGAKNWADVEALVTAGFTILAPWTKSDYESATAPTAEKLAAVPAITVYYNSGAATATGTLAASTSEAKKHIYLVYHPHESGEDKFDEYVANGDSWEKIGNTDIDLSGYAKKGTYAGTAAENGAHTHTVTGKVTVPTVAKTDKKLAASASATAIGIKTTADAITGFGAHTTADAITGFGAHTTDTFVKSYPGATSKLVKAEVIPAVANGSVTPAVANGTATKTVFGDNTTASKVTVTAGSDASLSAGAQASFTQGAKASFTQGAKAAWSASVDANGIMSFSFTANGDDTFTANGDDTFTPNTLQTLSGGKATVVDADDVAVPVVSSNAEVDVAKAGTAVDVAKAGTAVSFATGALDSAGAGAEIMTGLGTAVTADSITALGTATTAAAITALGTATTAKAATAIEVTAQPTITLDGEATEGISYVSAITLGTEDKDLTNGAAASDGAHTHTTSTTI